MRIDDVIREVTYMLANLRSLRADEADEAVTETELLLELLSAYS